MRMCYKHYIAYEREDCPCCIKDEIIYKLEKKIEELEKEKEDNNNDPF